MPLPRGPHPQHEAERHLYYCFGCGATGDVIDLTAHLFDLNCLQAARKLAQDFGLGPDKPPSGAVVLSKPPTTPSSAQKEEISYCLRVLHDYRDLLTQWRTEFAPLSAEESLGDRFVEALHILAFVNVLIDCLSCGPAHKKADAAKRLLDGQLLPRMEAHMDALKVRSFSDNLVVNLKKYNLEHTNNILNSSGRRVWGYLGIEALVRPEPAPSSWGR